MISQIKSSVDNIRDKDLKKEYLKNYNEFLKDLNFLGSDQKKINLILFLGAGISINYEVKMWKEFAKELILKIKDEEIKEFLKCKIEKTKDSSEIKYGITIAFKELEKENKLEDILKEQVFYDKELEQIENIYPEGNHVLKALKKFQKQGNVKFITTNIDRLLECYLEEKKVTFQEFDQEEDKHKIIKLHGCIDDGINSLIFTPNQYANMYMDIDIKKVKNIFNNSIVLFVGKSLEDEILQMILRNEKIEDVYILNCYQSNEEQNKMIDTFLKCEKIYYSDINIKVLPYSKYEHLPNILDQISEEIGLRVNSGDLLSMKLHILKNDRYKNYYLKLLREELDKLGDNSFKSTYGEVIDYIKKNEKEIKNNLNRGYKDFYKLKKLYTNNKLDDEWGEIDE
ncbi:MAG: SIR2 family protein [Cetobacterium sp.]|uniref:SIR2 family protein n=1 Tax=Cetobacterium sp. TaxID=2071632 RepID=UPI003F3D5514